MSKQTFRVVITKKVPSDGIEKLLTNPRVHIVGGKNEFSLPRRKLLQLVKGADAILSQLTDKIDDAVLSAAGPQLKIVANYAVGFDNINLQAAKKRNVMVTNTPGGVSTAVAEHAWVLALACAKRVVESDAFMRHGKYKEWTPLQMLGQELYGKTLGIVGLGRIGQQIAKIGHGGFQTPILYMDPHRNKPFEKRYGAKKVPLAMLVKHADCIMVSVPLLPSTHHLIGAKEFRSMKRSAIFINIARGPVVNEKALRDALKKKQIWAAGIDVYEHEPHMVPGLAQLSNIIVTPHTASATMLARRTMGQQATQNILRALQKKSVLSRVG